MNLATFAAPCPTAEEASAAVSAKVASDNSSDEASTTTLEALRAALEESRAGELDASLPASEVEPVLEAAISFEKDDSITQEERAALGGGKANDVLDELRAAGDFPEDPAPSPEAAPGAAESP